MSSGGLALLLLAGCDDARDGEPEPITVSVSIENVAEPGSLQSSSSDETRDILVSPGAWAVHPRDVTLFTEGEAASSGWRALAENGNPEPLMLELSAREDVLGFGPFPAQEGATYSSDPIGPGDVVTFEISATRGEHLSLATMFIHSNDILVTTPIGGIELGSTEMDVSDRLELWDAGTELNEEPGFGEHQPMQGPGGEPENGTFHRVEGTDAAGWSYPTPNGFLRVVLTPR